MVNPLHHITIDETANQAVDIYRLPVTNEVLFLCRDIGRLFNYSAKGGRLETSIRTGPRGSGWDAFEDGQDIVDVRGPDANALKANLPSLVERFGQIRRIMFLTISGLKKVCKVTPRPTPPEILAMIVDLTAKKADSVQSCQEPEDQGDLAVVPKREATPSSLTWDEPVLTVSQLTHDGVEGLIRQVLQEEGGQTQEVELRRLELDIARHEHAVNMERALALRELADHLEEETNLDKRITINLRVLATEMIFGHSLHMAKPGLPKNDAQAVHEIAAELHVSKDQVIKAIKALGLRETENAREVLKYVGKGGVRRSWVYNRSALEAIRQQVKHG